MPPEAVLARSRIASIPAQADVLSERDYSRLSELISAQVGIKLPATKRMMVEGRLRKRMRAHGQDKLSAYCRFLFDEGGLEDELTHLIDVVTTNKTDFFREPEHFEWLRRHGAPERLAVERHGSRLKVWSAACSNGAEPYTLAMVLADCARSHSFDFAVLATDISTEVLAQGKRAIYPLSAAAPIPQGLQDEYMLQSRDPGAKEFRIGPELRQRVRFARLNLMDPTYPVDRDVDFIFLRNVLIYFDKPTQEAVVRRLMGHLRPGGHLFLGHSESMIAANLPLRQRAPSIFQKP